MQDCLTRSLEYNSRLRGAKISGSNEELERLRQEIAAAEIGGYRESFLKEIDSIKGSRQSSSNLPNYLIVSFLAFAGGFLARGYFDGIVEDGKKKYAETFMGELAKEMRR